MELLKRIPMAKQEMKHKIRYFYTSNLYSTTWKENLCSNKTMHMQDTFCRYEISIRCSRIQAQSYET